jgi:hypothetical protein
MCVYILNCRLLLSTWVDEIGQWASRSMCLLCLNLDTGSALKNAPGSPTLLAKIGSTLYAAVVSRRDIACAASYLN